MMNFKIQRFQPGHKFYSNAAIKHTGTDKIERRYVAVFSQFVNEDGSVQSFSMERLDTLIPEGCYNYSIYYSDGNKHLVLLLHDVPGYKFIEIHIANYPYEVKGCTAVGKGIVVSTPMLISSGIAFNQLMYKVQSAWPDPIKHSIIGADGKLIVGDILGTITYEKLPLAA